MDSLTMMYLALLLSSLQQLPQQLPASPPPASAQNPQSSPALKAVKYTCKARRLVQPERLIEQNN